MLGWLKEGSFGGQGLNAGPISGLRLTVGGSLGPQQSFGMEGSGLWLEKRSTTFETIQDPAGNPSPHSLFPRR